MISHHFSRALVIEQMAKGYADGSLSTRPLLAAK
jgi:hypothetical protein